MTRTEYVKNIEMSLGEALKGGAKMLEQANEYEKTGFRMMDENKEGSKDWEEGALILGFAQVLKSYYDMMF